MTWQRRQGRLSSVRVSVRARVCVCVEAPWDRFGDRGAHWAPPPQGAKGRLWPFWGQRGWLVTERLLSSKSTSLAHMVLETLTCTHARTHALTSKMHARTHARTHFRNTCSFVVCVFVCWLCHLLSAFIHRSYIMSSHCRLA